MKTWSNIYLKAINEKGDLANFISKKERRSAGALISRLRKNLPAGASILEIGTGTGAIGALLTKYVFKVTAIDNDPEMVEIAKQSFSLYCNSSESVYLSSAENITKIFKKGSFDCIITHGMLEHYSDNEIIEHIKRQLDISQLVVCVVPMSNMSANYRSKGLGDERYLTTKYWENLFRSEFTIINTFGFGFKETRYPKILEKLLKAQICCRVLARFCAFNEFWIKEKK